MKSLPEYLETKDLVQRRLPGYRDADQRRLQRQRDERRHGQPEPLAVVVDGHYGHACGHLAVDGAEIVGGDHPGIVLTLS